MVQNIARPVGLTTTAIPVNAQLTCTNNSVTFTAGATTPGLLYSWSGPGVTSVGGAITATATGTYVLVATDPTNGCTATAELGRDAEYDGSGRCDHDRRPGHGSDHLCASYRPADGQFHDGGSDV
ncbi:hypothetical protein ACQ86N_37390 [Puia sp. P3]|uniref:hypothetical protein n=1 Tax=Puia sp. P3 TaxID=3423952 RepID=UPI003D67CD00